MFSLSYPVAGHSERAYAAPTLLPALFPPPQPQEKLHPSCERHRFFRISFIQIGLHCVPRAILFFVGLPPYGVFSFFVRGSRQHLMGTLLHSSWEFSLSGFCWCIRSPAVEFQENGQPRLRPVPRCPPLGRFLFRKELPSPFFPLC